MNEYVLIIIYFIGVGGMVILLKRIFAWEARNERSMSWKDFGCWILRRKY